MSGIWLSLAIHGVAGGLGVVAFSLIAETLKPKDFAGLFSAAPSIALASLIVAVVTTSPAGASRHAAGMVAGGVGMIAFCVVATMSVKRERAVRGSLLAVPAWLLASGIVYFALFQ